MLYPKLAEEMSMMRDIDQEARKKSSASGNWDEVESLDRSHTARMKEIVAEIGWPTVSLVGKEGSERAWLLVQHADLDPAFQKACLALMQAADRSEIVPYTLAYLEDRILVAEGKPQRYGTQFRRDASGDYAPFPIADLAGIDALRASVGLESMKEYEDGMRARNAARK